MKTGCVIFVFLVVVFVILFCVAYSKDFPVMGEFYSIGFEQKPVLIHKTRSFSGIMIAFDAQKLYPKKICVRVKSLDGDVLLKETIDFSSDVGILGNTVPGTKKNCETNWVREIKCAVREDVPVGPIRSFYFPMSTYSRPFSISVEPFSFNEEIILFWAPYYKDSW